MTTNDRTTRLTLELIDHLSGPAGSARAAIASLNRSFKGMDGLKSINLKSMDAFRSHGDAFRKVAESMALPPGMKSAMAEYAAMATRFAAPAAIAIGTQKAIAASADFEEALTSIRQKAGTTAAQTAELGEQMKSLAVSGKVAASIDEIADAFNRGAAAGIPLGDLKEFARLSATAADAFEMSATDVGNAAAGFSKILKIPMADMERFFDLVNALADSGIADEKDIVDFADRVGASLKQFGLANDQIAAYGATLLNLKVPAEVAANAMKAFTTRIAAPDTMDKKGKAWLERLVGDIPAFQKRIEKDANGALLELLDKINALDKISKTDALARIAGGNYNDNITTLADNLDEVRKNLRLAGDESKWLGSLGRNYKLRLENFWSQWKIAKNALEELAIDAGTMAMPGLKAALEQARGIVDDIGSGLEHLKASVDTTELASAREAVGDLGAAIAKVADMGGDGTLIGTFFDRIAQGANTASAAINAIKDAGQALGLIEQDDDTPAQRTRRRDRLIDGTFDGPLGVVPKGIYDAATNRQTGDTLRQAWETQDRAIKDSARTRGVSIEQVRAEIDAAARRRAERTGAPYRSPFPEPMKLPALDYPKAPPRDLAPRTAPATKSVPVPMLRLTDADLVAEGVKAMTAARELGARISTAISSITITAPDVTGPVRAEGERASAAAAGAAAGIRAALAIVVTPRVDLSSITSAKGAVDNLATAIRNLPSVNVQSLGSLSQRQGMANMRASQDAIRAAMATKPIPRAVGGHVIRGRNYRVGERGPEEFVPGKTGTIVPNHRLDSNDESVTNNHRITNGDQHFHFYTKATNAREIMSEVERRWGDRFRRSAQIAIDGRGNR